MASKKLIVVQTDIKTEKELQYFLESNNNKLICLEIYCNFAGPCNSLVPTIKTIKFGIGDGQMEFAKVSADKIEDFTRFRDKSEPIYLFISQGAITRVICGANIQQMIDVATEECQAEQLEKKSEERRSRYSLDTLTPFEEVWHEKEDALEGAARAAAQHARESRQAARKLWRAERMAPALADLNFIMFWPHMHQAHFDLYEKWDENDISVLAKEEVELTKEIALDVLYMSDVDFNEAVLHALLQGPALTVCFTKHDDRNFVELMRYILYESQDEIRNRQSFYQEQTAFEYFSSVSLTREEIYIRRLEERAKKREDAKRRFVRRQSEVRRLAKEAKEEMRNLRREQKQQERFAKLKAGINVPVVGEDSSEEDEPQNIEEVFEEEQSCEEEEEIMKENEYFPTAGLFIPGFYSPPNEAAKTNALAILFPKIVADWCTPDDEFLPPCLLLKLPIAKTMELAAIYDEIKADVIHMGFFRENTDGTVEHTANTINQYNKVHRIPDPGEYLAVMLSVSSDLSLLKLLELEPQHISMDTDNGHEECALLFPVGYADDENDILSTLSEEDI